MAGPSDPIASEVTRILISIQQSEPGAAERLWPAVHDELRRLARHRMAGESPDHTLQPTALVHEAWMRLVAPGDQNWQNRAHFFAAAAEAMRRILVENARRKDRLKHGGDSWIWTAPSSVPTCFTRACWRCCAIIRCARCGCRSGFCADALS